MKKEAIADLLLKAGLFAALGWCAVTLTLDARGYLARGAPKVGAVLASVAAIETNTTRTEAEMSGLLNETRHIAVDARKADQQELAAVLSVTEQARATLAQLQTSAKQLGDAGAALGTVGPAANAAIAKIAEDAHATMEASQGTLRAATEDLDSPDVKASLDHFANAAGSVEAGTKDAAGALADVHSATSYELAELKKPVTKAHAIFMVLLTVVRKLVL